MTEATNEPAPPIYFANAVTAIVNADEVSLEFRRLALSHAEFAKRTKDGAEPLPPVTPAEFYGSPPVAKVVLTFTAAKFLRDNLGTLIARFEQSRKEGH